MSAFPAVDETRLLNLPDDIIINDILPTLSLDQIRHLCTLNSRFAGLCQNELLWRRLYRRDFPNEREIASLPPKRNYRFLTDISKPKPSWETMNRLHARAMRFNPEVQQNISRTAMTERPWRYITEDTHPYEAISIFSQPGFEHIDPVTQLPYINVEDRLNRTLKSPLPQHDEF